MCDVLFLGTAFSIDSHIPSTRPGILSCIAAGRANPKEGRSGCDNCRDINVVYLELLDTVGADNRGRKEESIDRVETWAEAIFADAKYESSTAV
jgi:hypothetical protein